ncbi:metalloregulator ArsR/SmtB family transcription factor [Acinetobacter dispersus]|uniref:metalloregulator ArsR/SmtB family transcription factor n=1 Tax=Acinetobacter dispersus TaxID=70348 RepID=UPI00132EF806|nr:metalloregulator ArsR/SmtB family transcription factor [Acinetobacter dispersus]QHH98136.1 metalloregulator ArsR/SmtB family transcription factor [Acinetobacter dispersus]
MEAVEFFKCLSDETRLNIVMLVTEHQELCVCDLTEKLQLSQPKISRHLALLRTSGLLLDRRQGQWVYYRIADQLPTWCSDILNVLNAQNLTVFPRLQSLAAKSCCE